MKATTLAWLLPYAVMLAAFVYFDVSGWKIAVAGIATGHFMSIAIFELAAALRKPNK